MPDIPVERVFALVEAENDVARTCGPATSSEPARKSGLSFSEDWRAAGEEAGPLPALFLRETAKNLERNPVRLSLFLGSDAPINSSNRFEGMQEEAFGRIRSSGEPQFFQMPDTRLHTAMFPDEALTEACVSCHNEHEDSPKKDWKLHDVMGATTWAYPERPAHSRGDDQRAGGPAQFGPRGLPGLSRQGRDLRQAAGNRRALAARGLLPAVGGCVHERVE